MADFASAIWNKPTSGDTGEGGGGASDPVTRSLRLASGSSTGDSSSHLDRNSIGTPTDGTKWTFSAWVKRSDLTNKDSIFGGGTSSSDWSMLRFRDVSGSEDMLFYDDYTDNTNYNWRWSPRFRDTSAWYNLMLVYDASQSSQVDKMKLYVNGVLAPSASTYNTSATDYVMSVNKAGKNQIIGNNSSNDAKANLLIADVFFLDGVSKTVTDGVTDFTESNGYGGLKPKEYTGTDFGNNGFHLKFDDSSDIGADDAGSNDFTANNLSSHDILLDTPSKNHATWNPLDLQETVSTAPAFAEGNLSLSTNTSGVGRVRSTISYPSTGKWYAEIYLLTSFDTIGVLRKVGGGWPSGSSTLASVSSGGVIHNASGTSQSGLASWSSGDILGIEVNCDDNTIQFLRNGSNYGTSESFTHYPEETFLTYTDGSSGTAYSVIANFGQEPTFNGNYTGTPDSAEWAHSPSSGFKSLNTGNLDAPAVTPAQNFDILTYNGNSDTYNDSGSTQNVTGVNFDVGMAWIKDRDNRAESSYTGGGMDEYGNYLFDTVTGTSTGGYNIDYDVASGMDGPELNSGYYGVTSFSAGSGSNRGITVDEAGETNFKYDDGFESYTERYVAWLWKLGSTGSSSTWNSSYTAPTTEHYNASAGVTTIDVAPASSGNLEVAHSLSAAPEFFFVTSDTYAENFSGYYAFHKDLSSGNYLSLDGNSAQTSDSTVFPSGAAHADYIKLGTTFIDDMGYGFNLRIWAFTGVEGYSKFGSYTPNGNVNGPFIYTGFRPAFVMTKWTGSYGGGQGWSIKDSVRDTYNPAQNLLHPNDDAAEGTNEAIDIVSNGFKIRATNNTINSPNDSAKYIFAAFAESPFKHANAR